MASKRNRPPEGTGGAVADSDLSSSKIDPQHNPQTGKTQTGRQRPSHCARLGYLKAVRP